MVSALSDTGIALKTCQHECNRASKLAPGWPWGPAGGAAATAMHVFPLQALASLIRYLLVLASWLSAWSAGDSRATQKGHKGAQTSGG